MDTRKLAGGMAAAVLAASTVGAASLPPELRFRTLKGSRASVHYHQGLEPSARHALALSEELLGTLEARYGLRIGRVHVVLADVEDEPNGFATPLPFPLVHLRLAAPSGADELGNYEDWLRLLLTHELTHVVHIEQARGWWGAARSVLGRAPFLFPNALTPMWMVEGLATFEETERTAFGRGRDPDSRMVLRMEALDRGLPREDEPARGLDRWPAGQAGYLFGEAFARDVQERFGPDALPTLARSHAGRAVPFLDEVTFGKVTGAGLHQRWEEWRRSFGGELAAEAEAVTARGITGSRPLTTRGVRQLNPRFSPDGAWIAYTSGSLTRQREVRVMRADGTDDRRLARRNGGTDLAWTPDGRAVVFDEPERHRLFRTVFDLRLVALADGRTRRLTRGVRARDPDVSRAGTVVFVRQEGDRSELAVVDLEGANLRDLTRSPAGVQWSGPAFAPDGQTIVASRWSPGGWLDLVQVDAATGAARALTLDRAKDVEPAFTPGGEAIVFRSDRDGVSNLYSLRLADGSIARLTNVLGGAFTPGPDPSGRELAFSSYTARGYDVHVMALDDASATAAAPFLDARPVPAAAAPPSGAPDRGYSPLATLAPRFWFPYFDTDGPGTTLGVVTGGTDALFRHAWALDLDWNTTSRKAGGSAYYLYDRYRPTFLVAVDVNNDSVAAAEGAAHLRDRELVLQASLPLLRNLLESHSVSLSWRRKRETVSGTAARAADLGGLEAAWTYSSARQYPYSISPVDGARLRAAALVEDPALGSDVALTKIVADARTYLRTGRGSDALALRAGGGTTLGRPAFRQSYAVGGFPDASLLDVIRTNQSVLRGYPTNAFTGRKLVHGNVEYRFALAHPQRGWRTAPLFVRHLHGAVFADAGHAWSGAFRLGDVKTALGAVVGADVYLGHGLPLTTTLGVARGLAAGGETQVYFRTGLSF